MTTTSSNPTSNNPHAPQPGSKGGGPEGGTTAGTRPNAEGVQPGKVYIAVTVDDLPAHGPLLRGQTVLDVHRKIIETLVSHRVPKAHGFVNAAKTLEYAEGRAVLQEWRDAGFPLGNHTWSHVDIDRVGTAQFIEEIERNDRALAELVGDDDEARRSRRWFRYPYLRQGNDETTLASVSAYLDANGYRVADVSIDFGDWAYNAPYARCAERGFSDVVHSMRSDYMRRAEGAFEWSRAAAQSVFGHDIPHVLLLHSGAFDAEVLDELLTRYEKNGAEWVTLDEAQNHAAYQSRVQLPLTWGASVLERLIERDKLPHPPFLTQSYELLQHLCL